jgi:polyphosphate glucokinase
MPPARLVDTLAELVSALPDYDRVSVGFPGVVRGNMVVTAPHFVTEKGPGTPVSDSLVRQWRSFALGAALAARLGRPVRLANDADMQGAAVIRGHGLELVVTLGTGVGTGLFFNGQLAPHLEVAHHPFRHGETYNEHLGEAARKRVGNSRWNKRVRRALATLHELLNEDHLYIGGGNSSRITFDVGPHTTIVDNAAGILGGIKLWERSHL